MKSIKILIALGISFIIFINISCEKLISVDLNHGELSEEIAFRDSVNAEASVIGLYLNIIGGNVNSVLTGGMTLLTGLAGNELQPLNSSDLYKEYFINDISPSNSNNDLTWQHAYKLIYMANACLEGVQKSEKIADKKKNQLLGEIYQIRSLLYFCLVQLYGDVPLVLSTNYKENQIMPRTNINIIFNQIVDDLESAKNLMDSNLYNPRRASYYSAVALLARVYFHLGRYQEAEIESDILISSGKFKIENEVETVFSHNSKEFIWSLPANDNNTSSRTREGFTFIPASSNTLPAFIITNELLGIFEHNDQRKEKWMNHVEQANNLYFYPYKYKIGRITTSSPQEYYSVIRITELYLIRSEARVRNGNLKGGVEDLNIIRKRAGISEIAKDYVISDILEHINLERRREMFCEWGSTWIHYKRLNILNEEMRRTKDTWDLKNEYFPIPQSELERNYKLIQNPGY